MTPACLRWAAEPRQSGERRVQAVRLARQLTGLPDLPLLPGPDGRWLAPAPWHVSFSYTWAWVAAAAGHHPLGLDLVEDGGLTAEMVARLGVPSVPEAARLWSRHEAHVKLTGHTALDAPPLPGVVFRTLRPRPGLTLTLAWVREPPSGGGRDRVCRTVLRQIVDRQVTDNATLHTGEQ